MTVCESTEEGRATPSVRGVRARVRRRLWPLVVTALTVVTGMAYGLLWGPVVHHVGVWAYPGDIWGAYRSAHFIAWGSFGSIYAAGTGLVTFPGILLLLVPCTMLTAGLGLTESFPFFVPHPTAWLVLGPSEMILGCSALFACDALAERLGVSRARRAVLCVVQGVVLWPVLALWGHPEDAVALALAVFALVLAVDHRWTGAGWLFGAAVATQPLVLLMLPVLLGAAGRRRAAGLVARAALPGVLLIAAPLVAEFHVTLHALVTQPNFPGIDHATPWTALAPRLGGHGKGLMVAAGPGRLVALALSCALGWWARRWRTRPELLVWATGMALALRCLTESVMVAFYLWPALAVGLVVIGRRSRRWVVVGVAACLMVTVSSEWHLGQWWWWSLTNGGLLVALAAAFPPMASRVRRPVPIPHEITGANADVTDTETMQPTFPVLVGSTQ